MDSEQFSLNWRLQNFWFLHSRLSTIDHSLDIIKSSEWSVPSYSTQSAEVCRIDDIGILFATNSGHDGAIIRPSVKADVVFHR